MRTRIIVIGAFLCAAVLPAVLAAALYVRARHVHCIWSADYCVPLNGLVLSGSGLRGSAITFGAEAIALGALAGWHWLTRHKLDWSDAVLWALFLCGLAVASWILSRWALDVYQRLYEIAPAQPSYDAERTRQYHEMLYNAYNDYSSFGIIAIIFAVAFLITCFVKLWRAFRLQELDDEIALHEERLSHEHAETIH